MNRDKTLLGYIVGFITAVVRLIQQKENTWLRLLPTIETSVRTFSCEQENSVSVTRPRNGVNEFEWINTNVQAKWVISFHRYSYSGCPGNRHHNTCIEIRVICSWLLRTPLCVREDVEGLWWERHNWPNFVWQTKYIMDSRFIPLLILMFFSAMEEQGEKLKSVYFKRRCTV